MSEVLAFAKESEEAVDLKTLPYNYEAEQALLAGLLHDNMCYERVSEFLIADHFAHPAHVKIYKAITRLIDRNQIADPITLKNLFEQESQLDDIGGASYLAELAANVVSVHNMQDYGHLIHDLYLRRQLIHLGGDIATKARKIDMDESANEQIEMAEQCLFNLVSTGSTQKSFVSFTSALTQSIEKAEQAFKRDSKIVGVTSGLTELDRWLGGLHNSDLLILAGRPSMGKTALATTIAFNAARAALRKREEGGVVAFFSLEMSAEQLATRLLACESGVTSDKIRRGELLADDFPKFVEVSRELAQLPLFIDDTPALTVSALRTRARRLKRKENLGLIVIDYLQLLQVSGSNRSENRVQELSEITRNLKALAKELDVPIIALSQLSRAVEQRDDKRPQLSDLRESGSIEQDADVVMFVYRPVYYEERKEPEKNSEKHQEWMERIARIHNIAELIIAKQRHGPVGKLNLFFDSRVTKFRDLAKEEQVKDYA